MSEILISDEMNVVVTINQSYEKGSVKHPLYSGVEFKDSKLRKCTVHLTGILPEHFLRTMKAIVNQSGKGNEESPLYFANLVAGSTVEIDASELFAAEESEGLGHSEIATAMGKLYASKQITKDQYMAVGLATNAAGNCTLSAERKAYVALLEKITPA